MQLFRKSLNLFKLRRRTRLTTQHHSCLCPPVAMSPKTRQRRCLAIRTSHNAPGEMKIPNNRINNKRKATIIIKKGSSPNTKMRSLFRGQGRGSCQSRIGISLRAHTGFKPIVGSSRRPETCPYSMRSRKVLIFLARAGLLTHMSRLKKLMGHEQSIYFVNMKDAMD